MRCAFGYNSVILLLLQAAETKVHVGGKILHHNPEECDVHDEDNYVFEEEQCVGDAGYSLRAGRLKIILSLVYFIELFSK